MNAYTGAPVAAPSLLPPHGADTRPDAPVYVT